MGRAAPFRLDTVYKKQLDNLVAVVILSTANYNRDFFFMGLTRPAHTAALVGAVPATNL